MTAPDDDQPEAEPAGSFIDGVIGDPLVEFANTDGVHAAPTLGVDFVKPWVVVTE